MISLVDFCLIIITDFQCWNNSCNDVTITGIPYQKCELLGINFNVRNIVFNGRLITLFITGENASPNNATSCENGG